MAIQAELHDGRILEFPDGTDPSVVQATVKKVLGINAEAPAAEKPAPVERKLGLSSALAKDDSFSSMLSRDNSGIRAPITA